MFGVVRDPEVKAGVEDVDVSGQRVLVTGSTSGLGRSAALAMGRLGAALEAVGADARFVAADFTQTDEVAALAAAVDDAVEALDVLCNKSGGLFGTDDETELGVGRTFHINHRSPYRLTAELLPTLSSGARVVTTASYQLVTGSPRRTSTRSRRLTGLLPWTTYCRSKLATVRFANELARRLVLTGRDGTGRDLELAAPRHRPGQQVLAGTANPPPPAPQIGRLAGRLPMTDSVQDGAATIVYLAAADEGEGVTDEYFARCSERRPAPDATDVDAQRDLWRQSVELLTIEEPLPESDGEN